VLCSVDRPTPLARSLLERTHFSIARRTFREVVVPGIADRAFSSCELVQKMSRRAAYPPRVWVCASKHDIELVLWNERVDMPTRAMSGGLSRKIHREPTQGAHQWHVPFVVRIRLRDTTA